MRIQCGCFLVRRFEVGSGVYLILMKKEFVDGKMRFFLFSLYNESERWSWILFEMGCACDFKSYRMFG